MSDVLAGPGSLVVGWQIIPVEPGSQLKEMKLIFLNKVFKENRYQGHHVINKTEKNR